MERAGRWTSRSGRERRATAWLGVALVGAVAGCASNKDFDALAARVDALEASHTTIEGRLDGLDASVDAVESGLAGVRSDAASAVERASAAERAASEAADRATAAERRADAMFKKTVSK